MRKLLELLLCLLLLTPLAAAPPTDDEDSSVGSWIVQKGLEGFMYSIADSIYGVNESTNRSSIDGMMVKLLTWTPDPFEMQEVRKFQDYSFVAFLAIAILTLCLAFIERCISFQQIEDILGGTYAHNQIITALVVILIIPVLGLFVIWALFQVNYVVSYMLADKLIMTIPLTGDRFVAYLFLAIAYLGLMLVMVIRAIWLTVFVAVGIIVGVFYSVHEFRPDVESICIKFLSVLFLQPKLLLITVLGLIMATIIPDTIMMFMGCWVYVAIIAIVCYVGFKSVFRDLLGGVSKLYLIRRLI